MPRPCSVCTHAERSEIERALAAGEPFRKVAGHYALSVSALHRHMSRHVSTAESQEEMPSPSEDTPLEDRVAALEEDAQGLRRAVRGLAEAVLQLAK